MRLYGRFPFAEHSAIHPWQKLGHRTRMVCVCNCCFKAANMLAGQQIAALGGDEGSQSVYVQTLTACNVLGRLFAGLVSDWLLQKYAIPRSTLYFVILIKSFSEQWMHIVLLLAPSLLDSKPAFCRFWSSNQCVKFKMAVDYVIFCPLVHLFTRSSISFGPLEIAGPALSFLTLHFWP